MLAGATEVSLPHIAATELVGFVLVLCRVGGLFVLAPIFSGRMIPAHAKLMVAGAISFALLPLVQHGTAIPTGIGVLPLAMKEILVGLAIALALGIVAAGIQFAASVLDTTIGFRSQKFGTAFSEFQGLALESDEGDLKLYTKKEDNLRLGPVKLEAIVYHFFQDKFFGVSLHTANRDNTLGLLRVADAAFGEGSEHANAKDDLDRSWEGKSADAFFNVNPKTEEGSLFIRDNQLATQVETYREKLTKEAANDL